MRKYFWVASLIIIGLCLNEPLAGQESYTARLMTRGGPNSEPVIKVQFVIESYSTGEEVWRFQKILTEAGYEPFIQAFRQEVKGHLIIHGTRGLKVAIHVAHVIPKENGRKIMLFTEKQSWDLGEFGTVQRMDDRYPYMVFELDLDNRGKGSGKIYENAQIKFSGDRESGTSIMEMDSYNSTPKNLFGVSLVK